MEVLGVDNNMDKAKTHLRQVPTSILKRKKETSLKLSASTAGKRAIMLTGGFKKENISQKTSDGLGNFYASDCNYREGG